MDREIEGSRFRISVEPIRDDSDGTLRVRYIAYAIPVSDEGVPDDRDGAFEAEGESSQDAMNKLVELVSKKVKLNKILDRIEASSLSTKIREQLPHLRQAVKQIECEGFRDVVASHPSGQVHRVSNSEKLEKVLIKLIKNEVAGMRMDESCGKKYIDALSWTIGELDAFEADGILNGSDETQW